MKSHRPHLFAFVRKGSSRARAIAFGTLAILLTVSLTAAVAATYKPTVIRVGNLVVTTSGGIWPTPLPKDERVPIKASVKGNLSTVDNSHIPPAASVTVDVDEDFLINAKGLPVCSQGKLTARSTEEATRACGEAIVGRGFAEAEVAFPEQAMFTARGPLLFFNGGVRGGKTLLLVHLYAAVPAPTAIVTPVVLSRINDGHYGIRAVAHVPRIAGGSGSIRAFKFSIGRDFSRMGKPQGYIEAKCPTGSYFTRANVVFRDESSYQATLVLPCGGNGKKGADYYR